MEYVLNLVHIPQKRPIRSRTICRYLFGRKFEFEILLNTRAVVGVLVKKLWICISGRSLVRIQCFISKKKIVNSKIWAIRSRPRKNYGISNVLRNNLWKPLVFGEVLRCWGQLENSLVFSLVLSTQASGGNWMSCRAGEFPSPMEITNAVQRSARMNGNEQPGINLFLIIPIILSPQRLPPNILRNWTVSKLRITQQFFVLVERVLFGLLLKIV